MLEALGSVETTSNHPWADLARIVLVLVLGGGNVMVSGYVLFVYARVYALDRKIARIMGRPGRTGGGLLPRHVALVSSAYIILTLLTMTTTFGRLHDPLTWRAPVAGLAFAFGLWALWDVLGHERARMIRPPSETRTHPPDPPPTLRP